MNKVGYIATCYFAWRAMQSITDYKNYLCNSISCLFSQNIFQDADLVRQDTNLTFRTFRNVSIMNQTPTDELVNGVVAQSSQNTLLDVILFSAKSVQSVVKNAWCTGRCTLESKQNPVVASVVCAVDCFLGKEKVALIGLYVLLGLTYYWTYPKEDREGSSQRGVLPQRSDS